MKVVKNRNNRHSFKSVTGGKVETRKVFVLKYLNDTVTGTEISELKSMNNCTAKFLLRKFEERD